jgi:hypothetical protein
MLSCVERFPFTHSECSVTGIFFPPEDQLRSRKVVSRSNSRPTIKYPSWKNQRMIQCESVYELNACFLLDSDNSVIGFHEQPCRIDYITPKAKRSHYPDFLVEKSNGTKEFWEVKADLEFEKEDVILREELLRGLLPDLGYEYRLVCGKSMRSGFRLKNAHYLVRNGRTPLDMTVFNLALEYFTKYEACEWKDFSVFDDAIKNRLVLARLILEGYVLFDPNESLSESSRVWWSSSSAKAGV